MLLLGLVSTFTSTCLMGYLKFGKKKCFLKSHVYLSLYCNYNCSWMTFFIIHLTSVDTEMCCPEGKCGCQYFILLTLKKKIMDTGSWIFFNKKLILDYYFCLKSGSVFLFQIFIITQSQCVLNRSSNQDSHYSCPR